MLIQGATLTSLLSRERSVRGDLDQPLHFAKYDVLAI